ncbi:hypothetical protein CEXT_513891 [Caerostris extrusa]|uniref:Uncharacterized protein n=1 Tax=Caerostris extrusa TaxID=172846 RepID=A0AAV4NBJ3_CAEEX|nr:hypothetical protein CEXT_513891 [Caerostris extrusa]
MLAGIIEKPSRTQQSKGPRKTKYKCFYSTGFVMGDVSLVTVTSNVNVKQRAVPHEFFGTHCSDSLLRLCTEEFAVLAKDEFKLLIHRKNEFWPWIRTNISKLSEIVKLLLLFCTAFEAASALMNWRNLGKDLAKVWQLIVKRSVHG